MFWDSSALVPTVVEEPSSARVLDALRKDPDPAIWWGTPVECHSALRRHLRQAPIPSEGALDRLETLVRNMNAIAPSDELRLRALRLLATHPLHAGDALQLAAALAWCQERTQGATLVTLDSRLAEAARKEGFRLLA
jgi:predicted nucleic acid-binding protein